MHTRIIYYILITYISIHNINLIFSYDTDSMLLLNKGCINWHTFKLKRETAISIFLNTDTYLK